MIQAVAKITAMASTISESCIFCQIAHSSTSTVLLHQDDKVVAFQDINPSAFRHYLVIPTAHIPTVNNLERRPEDFSLVSQMLNVGQSLLLRDAPHANEYRFGFHQPPFNSIDHLHLHCLARPYIPRWRAIKYSSLGPYVGFIEAAKLLERIKPSSSSQCPGSHSTVDQSAKNADGLALAAEVSRRRSMLGSLFRCRFLTKPQ